MLQQAEEPLLLAFIADDRPDGRDDGKVAVDGCLELDVLECAEDEICEGAGDGDGVVEGRGVEVVLACLGSDAAGGSNQAGGLGGVQVFLSDDALDVGGDAVAAVTEVVAAESVAVGVGGDVGVEGGEEGDFEELVGEDELERGYCVGGEGDGSRDGRQETARSALDGGIEGQGVGRAGEQGGEAQEGEDGEGFHVCNGCLLGWYWCFVRW